MYIEILDSESVKGIIAFESLRYPRPRVSNVKGEWYPKLCIEISIYTDLINEQSNYFGDFDGQNC